MTATRSLLLAGAVLLGATSAYADDDSRVVQHSIYDVVRGAPQERLQEGRSATATSPTSAGQASEVRANQDPFYFRKATESNDN